MQNVIPTPDRVGNRGAGFEIHEPSFALPAGPEPRRQYQIAVAGGKGGVGKTTIAANLALVLAESGEQASYVDCDVEEPNGHLLLRPVIEWRQPVTIPVPVVDEDACTLCEACARICQYGAIVCLSTRVRTFPELCHGCGCCRLVCPADAIREAQVEVGVVVEGTAGPVRFVQGRLNTASPMSSELIRETKRHLREPGVAVVDSPAGVSCPAVASLTGADYALVVAEPTPFGLNDLRLSVDMLRILRVPFGVVVNRADTGTSEIGRYCDVEGIEVLLVIPDDPLVAQACADGVLAANVIESYASAMRGLSRRADRRLVQ